jgi:hypothetical protein
LKIEVVQADHKLTSAMMILLPNVRGAAKLTEFRPRSLIHGFAKLVAKILARRLQPRMAEPAPPAKALFIKRRSILDNFTLVQALVKTFK